MTVSYTGNSNTEVGTYTVTAIFTGDTDNYQAVADMTATLTINEVVVDDDTDTGTSTEEGNTLWWIIPILAFILTVELIMIGKKSKRLKKEKDNNTKTYAVSPLAFLLTVPMWELAVIATLAVLVIIAGIVLAALHSRKTSDDQGTVVTVEQEVAISSKVEAVVEVELATVAEDTTQAVFAVDESSAITSEETSEAVADGCYNSQSAEPVALRAVASNDQPQPTSNQQPSQPYTAQSTDSTTETAQPTTAVGTESASQQATVVASVVAMTQPKVASDDEVGFGGIDNATGKAIIIRYSKSFTAKLIQSSDIIQGYYTDLKNALHSYNGVKSRISWKWDSINAGKAKLAKFGIRGKSLYLYLALDPAELEGTKYKVTTATAKAYVATPCLYKVNGTRKLKFALELVAMLATKLALTEGEVPTVDYHKPYETTEALLGQKLIKELISKKKYQAYMDKYQDATGERKFIRASEVGDMMTTEQATAEMTASTEQYATEVASSTTATKTTYKVVGNKTMIVNVDTLSASFSDGDTVTLDTLKAKGLIAKNTAFVKVLARGTCSKSLSVIAHDFSIDAVKMILLTGGKVVKVAK